MSKHLLLPSLEIKGYRGFRDLRIKRLGRVNLVVGKNNIGKSALLEALWLYAYRGSPFVVSRILESRSEGSLENLPSPDLSYFVEATQSLASLYSGYKETRVPIVIGPIDAPERTLTLQSVSDETEDSFQGYSVQMNSKEAKKYRVDRPPRGGSDEAAFKCVFISATGLPSREVERLWDATTLRDAEQEAIKALQIIDSGVRDVNLRGGSRFLPGKGNPERVPYARTAGFSDPLPLSSLGEGMNRLFGITLALVNARDGFLLVDEVESGLHYTVQPDVWRLVFGTAHRLNTQVFATTHSWDCVEAFQKAAADEQEEEGVLVSLRRRVSDPDRIEAVLFDERKLGIATSENIEVR